MICCIPVSLPNEISDQFVTLTNTIFFMQDSIKLLLYVTKLFNTNKYVSLFVSLCVANIECLLEVRNYPKYLKGIKPFNAPINSLRLVLS